MWIVDVLVLATAEVCSSTAPPYTGFSSPSPVTAHEAIANVLLYSYVCFIRKFYVDVLVLATAEVCSSTAPPYTGFSSPASLAEHQKQIKAIVFVSLKCVEFSLIS